MLVQSDDDEGHSYGIGIQKISGNFTFDAGHYLESESYDPNDLGFLAAPNEVSSFATFNYRTFEPRGPIQPVACVCFCEPQSNRNTTDVQQMELEIRWSSHH